MTQDIIKYYDPISGLIYLQTQNGDRQVVTQTIITTQTDQNIVTITKEYKAGELTYKEI